MKTQDVTGRILRPDMPGKTAILLLARHAPLEPDYAVRTFVGDGGYPAYYHRVFHVLRGLGYDIRSGYGPEALLGRREGVDLVFSLLNRMPFSNPEVLVPSLCEYYGIASIGSRPNTRALAEDKWFSKLALSAAGVPVSPGAVYGVPEDLRKEPNFVGPYFIKNRFGAASEGIGDQSIQDSWDGARRVARTLMERGMQVLVEGYAAGIDITVPILGSESGPIMLGVVRPGSDRPGGIITEDLKRDDPLGYSLFDAGREEGRLADDVAALWRVAGPIDYTRLDYRFDPETGRRVFLEFNVCCHIGRSGAIVLAASHWGLDQADVLGHVVEYSLRRQGRSPEERRR